MLMRIRLWHNKSGQTRRGLAESGFSLLEVSLALLILGMIAVPFMAIQNANIQKAYINDTDGINVRAANAINQFYLSSGGRYPCPASLIAPEGEDAFGLEGNCPNLGAIRLCTDNSWRTTDGYCKTDNTADAVIIGAFPFKSIGAPSDSAIDVWGNKLLYAVTHQKTDSATFTAHDGAISMMAYIDDDDDDDGTRGPLAPTYTPGIPGNLVDDVDFVLISMGKAGYGAYTKDGILTSACRALADGLEHENCNDDAVFFTDRNPDEVDYGSRSFNEDASYFDDITFYQESVPTNLWFVHPLDVSRLITMASGVRVGEDAAISQERPQASLDVRGGDMRANGDIKSDEICAESGVDCIDPILIMGAPSENQTMQCDYDNTNPGNQAVTSIAENKVVCTTNTNTNFGLTAMQPDGVTPVYRTRDCGNRLVSGFDTSGDPICVIP